MTITRYAPGRLVPRARPGVVALPGADGVSPGHGNRRGAGRARTRAGRMTGLLLGADLVAIVAAAAATGTGFARGACFGVAVLAAIATAGLYRPRIGGRVSDQAGRLLVAAALPVFVLLPWTSSGRAMLLVACTAGLLLASRAAAAAGVRAVRRRGLLLQQALIVGGGEPARQLYRRLAGHPELGLRPCGVLDDQPDAGAGLPRLGGLDAAAAVLGRFDVSQVLVCATAAGNPELTAVLQASRDHGARVSVLPQLPEFGLDVPRACLDEIWGTALVPLRAGAQAPARLAAKRVTDLAAGSVLAILTAPLLLAAAVAVRLDLRMPPLFRQVRVVGRGRLATISKLRTLRPAGDPDTTWVIADGQCTALGRLLRGTHADELPQLGSVLRGTMSLVGPRPERPHFARQLRRDVPGYAGRERVSGGLTGWAQVHGLTGDTSIADRARFDNFYIEYWSVWLDLLILARTLPAALSGALTRGGAR